jgi:flagellar export protein FliJ
MSESVREFRALLKLRAIARRLVQSESRALTELERARTDALASLERLEAAIRTEEAVALGRTDVSFRTFAAYLSGAAAKRSALLQSCRLLDAEMDAKRQAVLEAEIEVKKLDHLADQFEGRRRKSRHKRDAEALDDAGRRSRRLRRAAG